MIIADGPDLWIVDDKGKRKVWLGRVDPKLAAKVVKLLNDKTVPGENP